MLPCYLGPCLPSTTVWGSVVCQFSRFSQIFPCVNKVFCHFRCATAITCRSGQESGIILVSRSWVSFLVLPLLPICIYLGVRPAQLEAYDQSDIIYYRGPPLKKDPRSAWSSIRPHKHTYIIFCSYITLPYILHIYLLYTFSIALHPEPPPNLEGSRSVIGKRVEIRPQ
ncbi:hypothetical protein F4781DRAFT_251860 [Annulohypoxylon bovei var. microspora]|nr:hypothetical protein F4781DRAFT_251860 [Annulohypoxylon bovei var. microspora]